MFGEPEDVDSECNARLFIGDNYGDGTATMRCQLAPGHDGPHREQYQARKAGTVTITWATDERERCDHGCGQWRHAHGSRHDDDAIPCPRDNDDHEFSDCAFCNPATEPKTCGYCGKLHYYEEGHLRHCAKKPFSCATCGESGVGNHDWPSGCPKERETRLSRGVADEFVAEDLLAADGEDLIAANGEDLIAANGEDL